MTGKTSKNFKFCPINTIIIILYFAKTPINFVYSFLVFSSVYMLDMSSEIHSVLFDKKKWTTAKARRWLTVHQLKPIKRVHKTEHNLRYRIINPDEFKKFSTKKTKEGIIIVIGYY